jgi:Protein of unknown function (DUF4232)/Caspase domain
VDGKRSALIVANDKYQDPGLRQLRAPAQDAEALAHVLGDPQIGAFSVRTLFNEPAHILNEAVEEFFADRRSDDLLLLHFSCHGVKDEDGDLYFATNNTRLGRLGATAVAADFVNRRMNRSHSRRIVLLLDCCYSGAFVRGMMARADMGIGIEEQFGGRGRAVITASTAMEYAFEGNEMSTAGKPVPSVFTRALVKALQTGEADNDGDGNISLDELYDYVYDRVREATSHQTPSKWVFGVQGDLYVARCRRSESVTPLVPNVPEVGETAPPSPRIRLSRRLTFAGRSAMMALGLSTLVAIGTAGDNANWVASVSHAEATAAQRIGGRQTATQTPIPSPTVSPSSTPSPTPTPIASATATQPSVSVERCHPSQLSLSFVSGAGGNSAGHIVEAIQLKNTASAPCSFYGFVGMQMLDRSSNPLPTRVVRNGGIFARQAAGPSQVIVGPNTSAFFSLSWSDVPVGSETCPLASQLIVTPPDEVDTVRMSNVALAPCNGGEIDVTPVVASLG